MRSLGYSSAAQKIRGRHWRLARPLDLKKPDRPFAASNGETVFEYAAGHPGTFRDLRAKHFHALHSLAKPGLEKSTRKRRQTANQIVDVRCRFVQSIRASDFSILCA